MAGMTANDKLLTAVVLWLMAALSAVLAAGIYVATQPSPPTVDPMCYSAPQGHHLEVKQP